MPERTRLSSAATLGSCSCTGSASVAQAEVSYRAKKERQRSSTASRPSIAWLVEVHDDRAYTLSTYTETLVPRGGGPRISVVGRLVTFVRRESDGAWRIAVLMNSHTRPMEELP
jgi:hypothetical protein